MCFPCECTVCGKTKWGGCGLHIRAVMDKVPADQRCHCPGTKWLEEEKDATPEAVEPTSFEYDLIVVGGGSGGLACAKEAAALKAKVCLLDFVQPSPQGSQWGLGGTCVNVGCIPKKLFHTAALYGEILKEEVSGSYGWSVPPEGPQPTHSWSTLVENVRDHIGSLNWGYRVQLRKTGVTYLNAMGTLIGPHTVQCVDKDGGKSTITGKYIVIATGGRPSLTPSLPGIEHCITSDDLFALPKKPNNVLVVGASYVALECAGFLAELGVKVTVMVRSILLRGFDRQIAQMIGDSLEERGITFIRESLPTLITKNKENDLLEVTYKGPDDKTEIKTFETVLYAIGRSYKDAGFEKIGIKLNANNDKIITDESDMSSLKGVYAIGDVNNGRPELTPVAIRAGKLLSRRLFGDSKELMDYTNIPTTIFTPIEYGSVGMSEETAIEKFGEANLNIYHTSFTPLEWTLPHKSGAYCKVICNAKANDRIVGLHLFSPNAGEIIQGYAVAIKLGATKVDLEKTVGIHPTIAEEFTTLNVTKKEQKEVVKTGC